MIVLFFGQQRDKTFILKILATQHSYTRLYSILKNINITYALIYDINNTQSDKV